MIMTLTNTPTTAKVLPVVDDFTSPAQFNNETDLGKMIQYISGGRWRVDYFNQVLGTVTDPTPLDPNTPSTLQQYTRINELDIHIDSPIDTAGADTITGTGYISTVITPYIHDVFKAMLAGNRIALLTINEVPEVTNYTLTKVYKISFTLDIFLDNSSARYIDLLAKVVKTYFYDRSHLLTNANPLLITDEMELKKKLLNSKYELIDYYSNLVINKNKRYMHLPIPDTLIVDPILEKFLFRIINVNDSPILSKAFRTNNSDQALEELTVLDAILNKDPGILLHCNKLMGVANTLGGAYEPAVTRLVHLGINLMVYPTNPDVVNPLMETAFTTGSVISQPSKYAANVILDPNLIPPITHYTTDGNTYIFTDAFYTSDYANMTNFETIVRMFMEDKVIDNAILENLVDTYVYWDKIQQFYLLPILYILIQHATMNTYNL